MRVPNIFSGIGSAPATVVLVLLNLAVFLAATAYAGMGTLPAPTALQFGALQPGALRRPFGTVLGFAVDGRWRMVASGFLHFSVVHLVFNMVCLLSWGAAVEQRLGTAWFLLLYAAALLGGGVLVLAGPPVVTAGASGALAGLLGTLLYLGLRHKLTVPFESIMATVAMNAAFTVGLPNVSWRAHLGGFMAGILACAALEAAALVSQHVLRCRFPEWLKLDLLLAAALEAAAVPPSPLAAGLLLLCLALAIKAADLALCLQRGMAGVAGAALLVLAPLLARAGAGHGLTGTAVAALVLGGCMVLHVRPLSRGWQDRSFLAAALQGARQRSRGL